MTNQPALKSSPAPVVLSTSSTSPNPAPPPTPLPLPCLPSTSAPPLTLHTQAAPSLHPRLLTPSQPNRTNPVACARQTIQPPPASMTWPNTWRRLLCTRCATSLHPRPLAPVCHHAARTAHRHPHSPVSAIRVPQTRSADANATASPAAVAVSRSIAVANAAATRTTAHRPVRASIPRARVTARKSMRRGGQGGKKPSLRRIMRVNQDTRRRSQGIRQLSRGDTRMWARAEGRGDDDAVDWSLLWGCLSSRGDS